MTICADNPQVQNVWVVWAKEASKQNTHVAEV